MGRAGRRGLAIDLLYPAALTAVTLLAVRFDAPNLVLGALAVAITAPLGAYVYRLAFAPVARSSVLTLLIVSMAVHYVLLGIGLLTFGPEGSRTPPFSSANFTFGTIDVSGHSLWVAATCITLVGALRWMFGRTLYGKALRAAASDPFGARLMGISAATTGRLSFLLAALIGALAGLLIAPITPVYYDTGFQIGLKGFVAAIIGGLASYPLAAVGALLVGIVESFVGFSYSAYREAIVFALIIPVLLWLSLRRSAPQA
jgi:branched-chain amino acid transport system permease protein